MKKLIMMMGLAAGVVSMCGSLLAAPQSALPIEVTGYSGTTQLADFPVLVRLPASVSAAAAEGGADLAFVEADGAKLAHEVDSWNSEGESLVWVKLPKLANGVKFYCLYGDAEAVAPSAAESAATWSGFAGVWHLGDADGTARDSGAWGLDGQSLKTVGRVDGKLGRAHMVSTNATKGVDGAIVLPDYSGLKLGDKFTVSMWVTNCFKKGSGAYHNNDWVVGRRTVYDKSAGGFVVRCNGSDSSGFYAYGNANSGQLGTSPIDPYTDWIHLAVCYSTNYVSIYVNGALVKNGKHTYNVRDNGKPLILGNSTLAAETGSGSVSWKGAFDEFRLRGMSDNADWFKAEYETVAKDDFLTLGTTQANGLLVASSGPACGAPNPAYGLSAQTAGAQLTCTATEETPVDATTELFVRGWRLERADGSVLKGEGASASFTYQTGDRLIWQTGYRYKLAVSCVGNGTTSYDGAWLEEGTTYTLKAQPGENAGFWKWTGDGIRATYELSDEMPLVIDGPKSVTANFGGVFYVSPSGDNGNDGSSWAAALAHPQAAINAANEGDTVILADGTYEWNASLAANSSVISLTKNVVVRSQNGAEACIVDAGRLTNENRRGLYIAAAATEAHVSGISFINGCQSNYGQNSPIESHAGLIDDVIVKGYRNNRTRLVGLLDTAIMRNSVVDGADMEYNNGDGQPCGVYLDGKTLLENCEIRNCTSRMSGVWLNGSKNIAPILENNPVVRGCYIHDNDGKASREGGGIRVNYYGTIENCTIVCNHSDVKGGGVFVYGPNGNQDNVMTDAQFCFRNNIIWGNTATKGDNFYGAGVTDFGRKNARNSCAPEMIEGDRGNTAQEPLFVDAENGDYRLSAVSPCVLADGTWMGAFAPVETVAEPVVGVTVKKGAVDGQYVFTAKAAGLGEGVTYAWTFGDGAMATGAEVTHSYALGTAAAYDVTVTATDAAGASATKTVEKAACIVSTVYVATDGGNVPPYDTWEKALTSIEAAVALKPSGIVIASGEYETFHDLIVESPTTIRSATGNPADVTIWGDGKADRHFLRLFTLNHAEAVLTGVTLSGGYFQGNNYFGSAVRIAAPQADTIYTESPAGAGGTVSNCVVTGCYTGGKSALGVIYAKSAKAVVTHVEISNNETKRQTDTGTTGGLALHLEGGALGRDLIVEGTTSTADKPGSIVYVKGSTLLNATVVNNSMAGVSAIGGVTAEDASALVQNCVIAGNTTTASNPLYATWSGTSDSFVNCAMDKDAPNDTCYAGAELSLADLPGGDYHPITGSKCINGGADHALLSGLDLDGNRRVQGEAVDIGCYEFDSSAFSVGFAPDKTEGFAPASITFTPTINGCDEGDVVKCYWDVDGDGVADYVTDGSPLAVTLGANVYSMTLFATNETKNVGGSLTVPNVVKVGPSVMYVKNGNPDAKYPFDSEANAAATMQSAIDEALDGTEIRVLPGVYQLADATAVNVDREITIGGATGNPEDVVLRGTTAGNGGPCLAMNAGLKALVHSMVFENGMNSGNGAVYISSKGGAVSNCVVRNCTSTGKWGWGVVRCDTDNGLVTHCVITNNLGRTGQTDGSNVTGIGADFSAGRLEHCLIARNRTQYNAGVPQYTGMGQNTVSLSGDAVARFLTVVSNTAWNVAGINLRDRARFEYCVIAGNHSSHTDATVDGYANDGTWSDSFTAEQQARWHVWGALSTVGSTGGRKACDDTTVTTEAADATAAFIAEHAVLSLGDTVKINDDCTVASAESIFKDHVNGDYRVRAHAPIVNVVSTEALAEAGIAMPEADVIGNARLVGRRYDLGAIECQFQSGAILMLR